METQPHYNPDHVLQARPEFSVVVTCYCEEATVPEFHRRLRDTMDGLNRSYEIVFVDDGSTDETLARLHSIFDAHTQVGSVIELFKNSGQMAAVAAGIAAARGKHFIFLDSDLQLDPEELPRLMERFDEGYDVVGGAREQRQDSFLRQLPSSLVRVLLQKTTKTQMRDLHCGFKIMDGTLVRGCEYGPYKPFNPVGIIVRARRCTEVPVTHHARSGGKSGWSWIHLFLHFMNHTGPFLLPPVKVVSTLAFLASPFVFLGLLVALLLPGPWLSPVHSMVIFWLLLLNATATLGLFWMNSAAGSSHFGMLRDHPAYIIRSTRVRAAETEKD